jgi:hypothetical protein
VLPNESRQLIRSLERDVVNGIVHPVYVTTGETLLSRCDESMSMLKTLRFALICGRSTSRDD